MSSADPNATVIQAGVIKAQAVSKTWTRPWLIAAYSCIILMAISTSFGEQVWHMLAPFATSSFGQHSKLSTVGVVSSVLMAVFQLPIAKIADVFGRKEAFGISLTLYCVGHALAAGSKNIPAYATAKVLESAGISGLKMIQQVFIADTSDIRNRMIFGNLPDVPFLLTVWVAPSVSEGLRKSSEEGWRWGYGMWAFTTPLFCGPLIWVLWLHQRRSGETFTVGETRVGFWAKTKGIIMDLDVLGTVCLSAGFSFLLLPMTIAASTPNRWANPGIITALVLGALLLIAFPFLQSSNRLCPTPIMPRRLLGQRNVLAGMVLAFFYFMAFYLSLHPYFYSYLMVTRQMDPKTAGYIMNTFSVSCTITVVAVGFLCKYTRYWKPYLYIGSVLYTLGIGLMLRFRNSDTAVWLIVFTQAIVGIGGAFINGPAQLGVQAVCEHSEVASATALFLTTLSLGCAVGSSISGAVWTHNVKSRMERYLPEEFLPQVDALFGDMTKAAGLMAGSPEKIAVDRAYDETMYILVWIAFAMCGPMCIAAWWMESSRLPEFEDAAEGRVVFGNMSGKTKVDVETGDVETKETEV